jgi:hypothetical protein
VLSNDSMTRIVTSANTCTNVIPARRAPSCTYKSTGHRNHRNSALDFQVLGHINDFSYKSKFDRRDDIIHDTADAAPSISDRNEVLHLTLSVMKRTKHT